jgi:hypothetical protein
MVYCFLTILQRVRLAGAGLFREKSTAGWLLMADLF